MLAPVHNYVSQAAHNEAQGLLRRITKRKFRSDHAGWTSRPSMWLKVEEAIKETGSRVRAGLKLRCCTITVCNAMDRLNLMRKMGLLDQALEAERTKEDRPRKTHEAVLKKNSERYYRSRELELLRNTREIDWSGCPMAKVYPWHGRMYGSEAAHCSMASEELRR